MPRQGLFVKPGSEVAFVSDGVSKLMSGNERCTYRYLNRHRTELSSLTPSISVPELLEYDRASGYAKLSYLGVFPNLSPRQYFGEWEGFTETYLKLMNTAFTVIHTLPLNDVPDQTDYEATIQSVPSSILYVEAGITHDMPDRYRRHFIKIKEQVIKSQNAVVQLPQYPSHRDPNPNNYSWHKESSTPKVGIVDWETFGLARKGYDEARLCTYLVLNEPLQQKYLDTICDADLVWGSSGGYFWRVVTMRAFRELTSFYSGHYDSRLTQSKEKSVEIIKGLLKLVERGIDESDRLLK